MATFHVLEPQFVRRAIATRSIQNATPDLLRYLGNLQLLPADLADSALSILIRLEAAALEGDWHMKGQWLWQGGGDPPLPQVTASGGFWRFRLWIDPSRPLSVGATVTTY